MAHNYTELRIFASPKLLTKAVSYQHFQEMQTFADTYFRRLFVTSQSVN